MFFLTFDVMVIDTFAPRTCFHFDLIACLVFQGRFGTKGTYLFSPWWHLADFRMMLTTSAGVIEQVTNESNSLYEL